MRRAGDERGATAVLVAATLLLLIGFASFALDSGLAYDVRRGTQNAADNAALAAAWEACNPKVIGSADPVSAARAMTAANGYDDNDPEVVVTVNDLGDERIEVVISTTNPTRFGVASPYAPDELTVVSRAVADCDRIPYLGGYAVFAGAESDCNGGVELDLSGSSKIINGGVHSNGDIKVTGSDTQINGPITYRGAVSGSTLDGAVQLPPGPPVEYPLNVSMTLFRGTGDGTISGPDGSGTFAIYRAGTTDIDNRWLQNNGHGTGNNSNVEITESAVYYTMGDIDLSRVTMASGVRATFVSDGGQISVNGEASIAGYYPVTGGAGDPGLLMYSTYQHPDAGGPTCTGNAIQWSMSSATWSGVIFAPYGQARQSTASSATLNGSIFAYTVNLSGSSFDITWLDNPDAEADVEMELVE